MAADSFNFTTTQPPDFKGERQFSSLAGDPPPSPLSLGENSEGLGFRPSLSQSLCSRDGDSLWLVPATERGRAQCLGPRVLCRDWSRGGVPKERDAVEMDHYAFSLPSPSLKSQVLLPKCIQKSSWTPVSARVVSLWFSWLYNLLTHQM